MMARILCLICRFASPQYALLANIATEKGNIELDHMHNRTPMRRLASPEEIAEAILFLGSDESSFITGHILYVDGGFMAQYGIPSSYENDHAEHR